jgi:hypothetical protein
MREMKESMMDVFQVAALERAARALSLEVTSATEAHRRVVRVWQGKAGDVLLLEAVQRTEDANMFYDVRADDSVRL